MKTLIAILIILSPMTLSAQVEVEKDWSMLIQKNFEFVKTQKIDTVLVYYSYSGPWTDIPESCNGINSVWVLWSKNNDHFAKKLICDSKDSNDSISISSLPFDYFIAHIKEYDLKKHYTKMWEKLPSIPSDGSWEYLIFMTPQNKIRISLSEYQRSDTVWKKLTWFQPIINAIDMTRNELPLYVK